METERIIKELKLLYESRKNDTVSLGEINWSTLCFELVKNLEELNNKNLKYEKAWIQLKEFIEEEDELQQENLINSKNNHNAVRQFGRLDSIVIIKNKIKQIEEEL